MKLIVGLGNFGKNYEHTRHNLGFDVIDLLASDLGFIVETEGFHSQYLKTKYFDENIILQKPLTYMNNSGVAVKEISDFFKIDLNDILVIHDDMDIEVGKIKLKEHGSSAGHNGIKSIINCLGSDSFKRIKIGIGKPLYNSIDFVLSKPSKDEKELFETAIKKANEAIKFYLKNNFDMTMSKFN